MSERPLDPATLAVRAGIRRSDFQEHSEALVLTSSFVFKSAEEAARRGLPMVGIAEDLRRLCERIRAIYRAAAGIVAKGESERR